MTEPQFTAEQRATLGRLRHGSNTSIGERNAIRAVLARLDYVETWLAIVCNDSDAYQRGLVEGAGGIVLAQGPCAWEGCGEAATHVAKGSGYQSSLIRGGHPDVRAYCLAHAATVSEVGSLYSVCCPNCKAWFGVG